MSVLSSVVMGLDGLGYCCLGANMLCPWAVEGYSPFLAGLYPSLFKHLLCTSDDGSGELGKSPVSQEVQSSIHEPLCRRLLAYLVLLFGISRLAISFCWGCGFVYLGLGSCIVEMAIISNELLRHDSLMLHRAVAVLLENALLSVVFMSMAAPYCK
jgi:hypothetical protein